MWEFVYMYDPQEFITHFFYYDWELVHESYLD